MTAQRTRGYARTLRKQMPDAEVILWSFLRRRQLDGLRFNRQHPIGPFIADFACRQLMLTVEVDGATHWTEARQAYDRRRTAYITKAGWKEIRVTNEDVYRNLDRVLEHIWLTAQALRGPPSSAAAR